MRSTTFLAVEHLEEDRPLSRLSLHATGSPAKFHSSSPVLPSPPSEKEARLYYFGLPSRLILVARTGNTPWEAPTGPDEYCEPKELRPIGEHAIEEVWEDDLALKLHTLLEMMQVKWTSTDVVRIGYPRQSYAPVVIWIGVMPRSLSADDGVAVVARCRELLVVEYDITDVEIEIRESVVTRSAGPKLLTSLPTVTSDLIATMREPLTTSLGLSICAQSTLWAEGTGGFFIIKEGNPKRLLLVTARHVVLPLDKKGENIHENIHISYNDSTTSPHNVVLLGETFLERHLESLKNKIDLHKSSIDILQMHLGTSGNNEKVPQEHQYALDKFRREIAELRTLHQSASTNWATPESRVIGHLILSPPIKYGAGTEGYTQDWAVIQIDADKIDSTNFNGNAINLDTTDISNAELAAMMGPAFAYPKDGFLRLKNIIPEDELRRHSTLDQNGNPCLMVIKRGSATGLTLGCANSVLSYIRHYFKDGEPETSKEWAILQFDSKSGAFSAKGDSGAVIVDGLGRMGGLLTGASGGTNSNRDLLDITYATPIGFILKNMEENGLRNPNIHPVLAR
ncbi:hypothetical protein BT96DRAFT_929422 [Gymnopus androsaceus JB14]|uniref:Trypsin-like serine protease n=1 Tax=Gymnopus androsaceus JB14 TaxID=1447944 RepID=A0A6A4GF63_9AGAR|nr:hypothetical protein BT96DRAFT_929422 [Gymnopus androsaceus JB14]